MDEPNHIAKLVSPRRAGQIMDMYGSEPSRWPEAERDGVLAALKAHPELAANRTAAANLDQLLDGAPAPLPAAGLAARIAAMADVESSGSALRVWLRALVPATKSPAWLLRPAATLAGAVVLGIVAGAFVPGNESDAVAEEFMALAFGPVFQLEELEARPEGGGAE